MGFKKRGTQEAQEVIRRRCVAAIRNGMSIAAAARTFGVSYDAAHRWQKAHQQGGSKALASRKRGRKHGAQRRLDAQQEAKLRGLIIDSTPEQLKLPFMLWERRAVQELVARKFGIDLPLRTVGEYLLRWGLSCQRPATAFYEQQPKAVKQWLKEKYPAIVQRAKQEGAEIQWSDEAGVSTSSAAGARGYALKGRTPVLKRVARPSRINHISSVTNQGKMRFMLYEGTFTADTFIKFLKQSVKAAKGRKIIMIVDNLRVHHSKAVSAWLADKASLIELEYLPAYSPELNPDEYLNSDVKANVHRRAMPRSKEELRANVEKHLKHIARNPSRVRSYFNAKHIRYAA
ncbi:MAG: IS630 family transposase [Prosthecobacter sp.]|nr:IS630 family transposase [Prosthecobacter sp.]